jgi:YfiH family protein
VRAFTLDDGPVPVVRCRPLLAIPGVAHGFSTRHADLGPADASPEVAARRLAFLRACGVSGEPLVLRQVHGAAVVRAWEVGRGEIPEGDAAVRVRQGRAPAVRTADCVPVLLADRGGRAVAAVHAGWRGVAAGVAGAAVHVLAEQGIAPAGLVAALGPAILGCCYTVGREVLEAVGLPGSAAGNLDLHARLRAQLREAGVPDEAIHAAPWCTRCHPRLFFSYRREKDGAGRQMAVIGPSS